MFLFFKSKALNTKCLNGRFMELLAMYDDEEEDDNDDEGDEE